MDSSSSDRPTFNQRNQTSNESFKKANGITVRQVYNRSDSSEENSSNEVQLEPFISKSWDFYSASPLYRVEYSDVFLKRRSKWMREQIAVYIKGRKPNLQYHVEFSRTQAFKLTPFDSDSLQVIITGTSNNKTDILYEGIFLSRGRGTAGISSFKYLPTLICRCTETTAIIIHGLLQRLFDCKICRIYLGVSDFKWLTAIFCTESDKGKNIFADFTFSIEGFKENLQVSIPLSLIRKLWTRVHKTKSKTLLLEEVEAFHQLFIDVVNQNFQIDLQKLTFHKIRMPYFSVIYPCKVKVSDNDLFSEFLIFINGITNIF